MKRSMLSAVILGTLGLGASFSALAIPQPVQLCAGEFQKDLTPGDATDNATSMVTMWGYSRSKVGDPTGCAGPFTSPGPRITLLDRFFDGVSITLRNTLPRPTSLVIPGTVKGMTPQYFTPPDDPTTAIDESLVDRVRSFDVEAPAGSIASPGVQVYTWNGLQPGSYMYHSGSHPQVQVQMGLYGALIDNVTNAVLLDGTTEPSVVGEAYPGVNYVQDIALFYSEIDRPLHEAVAAGNYDGADMQSTIGYAPKHFLIDVDTGTGPISYRLDDGPTIGIPVGIDPLVRFYNAGARMHVPTLIGGNFQIHAEDGKQYPNIREQYSVELPALKTKDATMVVTAGTLRLTDSAMALSSPLPALAATTLSIADEIANGDGNGMVLKIQVEGGASGSGSSATSADAPIARRDDLTVREGGEIDQLLAQALSNDSNAAQAELSILTYPKQGELIADGDSYRYEHDGGEEAQDSLVYELTNAAGETSRAGVVIDVVPVNDSPSASNDRVSTRVGELVEIRALRNDEDPDSKSLSITGVDSSSLGSLTAQDQVIVFEASEEGSEDVVYTIADSEGATASAILHLNVASAETGEGSVYGGSGGGASGSSSGGAGAALQAGVPEATADSYSIARGRILDTTGSPILGVLSNDSNNASVNTKLVEYPAFGAIEMNEDGTFVYSHDGSGSGKDDFVYEIYNAEGSAKARVTITITAPVDADQVAN